MKTDSKIHLVRLLADGAFHSGEQLAQALCISRAAIWKQVQAIRLEYGLHIDAVRGRGYRLSDPLELLKSEEILAFLPVSDKGAIQKLYIHHSIDSTNRWLMNQQEHHAPSGTVCIAEQQSAGKGRHGRTWVSPFGRNIYLSLLWQFDLPPAQLAGMSLAAGVAVARVLREIGGNEVGVKWPNDILWRGRKLAGLLLEVAGEAGGPSRVVIGLGLNTRLGREGEMIDQPWIDLDSIPMMTAYGRNELVARLLQQLLAAINHFQKSGLAGFLQEWESYDLLQGEQVVVRSASQTHQGRHLGVDASGAIKLEIDGDVRSFFAGEVSLRKVPGKPW